jgi:hypothetical protein
MIRINLLPPEITEKRRAEQRWKYVVFGAVALYAVLAVFWFVMYLNVTGRSADVAAKKQEAQSLNTQAESFKIFGVETISPDLVYLTDRYPTHRACAERGITHYENLNNLVEVVGRRFDFYGFPLKLEIAYGSPVRAVAILEESEALTE